MTPAAHAEIYASGGLLRRTRWYFRIVAANGEIIAASQGYASAQNAQRGVETLARALGGATPPVEVVER